MRVKPLHEAFESADLDVPADPNLLKKSRIVERKRADFRSRHAGLSMEIFGSIQQEAAELFLSGKFEIFTSELEIDRTQNRSLPASPSFSYGRIVD
ncbi:MAG TPA: hypothetical protein VGJ20_07185 [Xanthobacteraceae bacterium]